MSAAPRLLIFGGSFDPIHHGHLFIATVAAQHINAERVIFLPTARAPHRGPLQASVASRVAMLRLALAPNPHFALDESDLTEDASGYTVDVVPRIQAKYPDARLSFLVGEDAVTRAPWQRFDQLVAALELFLIAPRECEGVALSPALSSLLANMSVATRERMEVVSMPPVTISATEIRERIATHQSVRYLLPDIVLRYIHEAQLYRSEVTTCPT